MLIGVAGDIHWSKDSSIIRSRGEMFSTRLENLINSVNWYERLFEKLGCSMVVQVGDFFDKAELNAEEISALKKLNFYDVSHIFVVGNHELGRNDLFYNTLDVLGQRNNCMVVNEAVCMQNLAFLPYTLEDGRKPLSKYLSQDFINEKNRIIFSHNDIKGIQMGQFLSDTGFDVSEIQACCDLFINGHLHNGGKVADKVFNIGNLTGQNFSEDAFKYDHCVYVIDTDTLKIDVYENPFAFNFYKLDAKNSSTDLTKLKNNAVITLKCKDSEAQHYRQLISQQENIVESRIIVEYERNNVDISDNIANLSSIDSKAEFRNYILNTYGNSEIIQSELKEVLK